MAELEQRPKIEIDISLRLTEAEIRALEALSCYGTDPFLKMFYQHMGRSYLEPHEKGLRTLFESVRRDLPPIIRRADQARIAFVQGLAPKVRDA